MAKQRVALRVEKGALVLADSAAVRYFRESGIKVGETIFVEITKPRNPEFNGLAHKLGTVIAENVEAFDGMKGHDVLKKIQRDARIECDITEAEIAGMRVEFINPRSLSYESLDQVRFYDFVKQVCHYVSKKYWPSVSPSRIARMADFMVD